MQSRFMKGDKNPTLLILASSKRTEQSYMETFIESKKKNESKSTLVIDKPQWEIREDKDSKEKFKVAIGNKFLASEVLPLDVSEKDLSIYRDKGFTVIDVPIGYYENFIDDIDIALTDIAGISTSSSNRYISGPRLAKVRNTDIKNPFTQEIIEVGNDPEDTVQYYDFFNMENIDRSMMEKPLYIHLDMSISGDKTGIAGVWIKGKKPPVEGQPASKELFYQLAFHVSVKAPKGFQISFEKNRQFIYWLREQGFAIKEVTSDTFQSADLLQQLSAHGYTTNILSVDRVDTDHICKPYQYFKSTIYEERIAFYENKHLTEEIIGLERNNNSGKIDHSPMGINCFTGDTKIRLVDGRSLSILDLKNEFDSGKVNFVYSFNHETQRIEPKPISNVFKSGQDASLVEVTLDNGEKARCTPEHKFMLRDGTYCEAKNLHENQSLMPLYTKIASKGLNGYRLFYEPMTEDWHYEHRTFCNEILDEKYLVHHKDCNKLNNNPSNLIYCSRSAHQRIHAKMQSGAQSPQANNKRKKNVKKYHEVNKQNPEYWTRYAPYKNMSPQQAYESHLEHEVLEKEKKQAHLQRYLANQKKLKDQLQRQQEMAEYYGVDLDSLQGTELQALMIKYAHDVDPQYQEKVSKAVSESHKKGKYKNAYIALQKCNEERRGKPRPKEVIEKIKKTYSEHGPYEISEETRKKRSEVTKRRRWYNNGETSIYIDKDAPVPEGYVPGRIKTWKNHKVVSVRCLPYTEDVYDITIDGTHNFALDAGVFVHNSKDSCDAVCGALWTASKHGEEFDFDYGDTLDVIIDVAEESTPGQEKEQLTLDFENELKRTSNIFSKELTKDKEDNKDSTYLDFGLGAATTDFDPFLDDGIII